MEATTSISEKQPPFFYSLIVRTKKKKKKKKTTRVLIVGVVFMLGVTDLHNGMMLSTLNISFHGLALGFPKRSHTNEDSIPRL